MPFELGDGQRLTTTLIGDKDGIADQPLSKSVIEVVEGKLYYSSDWSYVNSSRFLVFLQNSIYDGLEWGVFDNNEMIAVDQFFPDICLDKNAKTYSYWLSPDQHWIRFCKVGCNCAGTNCWTEVVVCVLPLDSPKLNRTTVHLVDLQLNSLTATSRVSQALSPLPALTSLTLTGQKLKRFGYFHTFLGQAGAVSESDALTVANIGSSGEDGVLIDLNPLPEFFGPSPVQGYRVSLEPLGLPMDGIFTISALGRLDTVTNAPLAQAGLRHDGSAAELFADFAPLGSTSLTAAVFDQGTLVGTTQVEGGMDVASLNGIGSSSPRLSTVGKLPSPPFNLALTFEEPIQFDLAEGSQFTGDEIRLLPFEPTFEPGDFSALKLLSGGTGLFAIQGETILPATLAVRLVDGTVEVSWTGTGTLEEASDPAGPWQAVQPAPAPNPYLEQVDGQMKFFRLAQ